MGSSTGGPYARLAEKDKVRRTRARTLVSDLKINKQIQSSTASEQMHMSTAKVKKEKATKIDLFKLVVRGLFQETAGLVCARFQGCKRPIGQKAI